jgi:hypothetical protein
MLKNKNACNITFNIYIYIYIYIEREREKEMIHELQVHNFKAH